MAQQAEMMVEVRRLTATTERLERGAARLQLDCHRRRRCDPTPRRRNDGVEVEA